MAAALETLRARLDENGQAHVLQHYAELDPAGQAALLRQIDAIDFALINRLIKQWILHPPDPESFSRIEPVPLIPKVDPARPDAIEAREIGERALRGGRVGLLLVAGGQGTRLGFPGPKGAYPIGPATGKSLFAYHAEKIRKLQDYYSCTLVWYIIVSPANRAATEAFFQKHDFWGLREDDLHFVEQAMVPCVSEDGKFILETPQRLAVNPNGHGGCLPAMVDSGMTADARRRGVDTLSYFQVDNWAVKVADPYFIGYHLGRGAEMSSKNHRKNHPREAVGVHCLCDGEYRVIEYTELDMYPQLLAADADGALLYPAGNPAIHVLDVNFIERVCEHYDAFPWHCAHKKIPFVNEAGEAVEPEAPNGYKFETFIFDALRFIRHEPVALAIDREGEYTPIKLYEGPNSVVGARKSMDRYWGRWLEAAGHRVPRDSEGTPRVHIEISPVFALTQGEFVEKTKGWAFPAEGDIVLDAGGRLLQPPEEDEHG